MNLVKQNFSGGVAVRRYVMKNKVGSFISYVVLYSIAAFIFINTSTSLFITYINSNRFIKILSTINFEQLFNHPGSDLLSKVVSMVIRSKTGGAVIVDSESVSRIGYNNHLNHNDIVIKVSENKKYIGYTETIINRPNDDFNIEIVSGLHLEDEKNSGNYFNGFNIYTNSKSKISYSDNKFYLKEDSCMVSGDSFYISTANNILNGDVKINLQGCGSTFNNFLSMTGGGERLVDEATYDKSLEIICDKLEFDLFENTFRVTNGSKIEYDSSINIVADVIYGWFFSEEEKELVKKERSAIVVDNDSITAKLKNDYLIKKAHFDNNVVIKMDSYMVKSDYAIYDNRDRFIEFIDNVSVYSDDMISKSNYAIYDIEKDKIIFVDKSEVKDSRLSSPKDFLGVELKKDRQTKTDYSINEFIFKQSEADE